MPDYHGERARPLDVVGLVLFGAGTALLSWVLEVFGENHIDLASAAFLLLTSLSLLGAYAWHAHQSIYPLLRLTLFRVRTFRISVVGGFITRLGVGGLPFLLPLLYQVGFGFPAWQSGLLMMPAVAAAMGMKLISGPLLRRFGYRKVLIVNTLLMGITISMFASINSTTPIIWIVFIGLAQGLFNSLQFSSMNSMAYADIKEDDSSMASTIASSMQQMSMSFGLACGSLVAAWYLGDLPQSDQASVTSALHYTFQTLGCLTMISSLSFWALRDKDGESVSKGSVPVAE
jgi:MFS family permease